MGDDIQRLNGIISSSGDNVKSEFVRIKKILKAQRELIKKLEDRVAILECKPDNVV